MTDTTNPNFTGIPKELLDIIQTSVRQRGLEQSVIEVIATQLETEKIQVELHCVLISLIDILVNNNIINRDSFQKLVEENMKAHEKQVQEQLNKALNLATDFTADT